MRKTDEINPKFVKLLMGSEPPPYDTIDFYKYYVEAQEKLSVMRADFLSLN